MICHINRLSRAQVDPVFCGMSKPYCGCFSTADLMVYYTDEEGTIYQELCNEARPFSRIREFVVDQFTGFFKCRQWH